jgi:hypothetical protein
MAQQQTFKNHARFDPLFHFFIAPVFLLNIVATVIWYTRHHTQHQHIGPWMVLMSVALVVAITKIRNYSLKVQDRIIRLEERIRLAQLCTPAELIELESLTPKQYIALRFASNPELPELARRAVRENLTGKQIKEAIQSWRADDFRV